MQLWTFCLHCGPAIERQQYSRLHCRPSASHQDLQEQGLRSQKLHAALSLQQVICLKQSAVPSGPPGPDPLDVAFFLQGTGIWTTCC